MLAREVHVQTSTSAIQAYVETNNSDLVCFRCGEQGHVRSQCLTYKVRLCWHFFENKCRENNCTFAHGMEELRHPWRSRCVRVVKQGTKMVCIGCNSTEHTFRNCPLHKDLIFV